MTTTAGTAGAPALSSRLAVAGALALAAAAAAIAVRWGAFVAGGSDSYCYVAQAGMWLDGSMLRAFEPGLPVTWSHAELSFAPVGFVPSPHRPGAWAPICPPGLAIVMAAAQAIAGLAGVFAIVPLCGALTVWCAFVLGRRLMGPAAGLLAAGCTLASPIFLFQAVQPMSDVPATALWLAALAAAASGPRMRASAALAGIATALAVLIRPNLVPLALPVALVVAIAGGPEVHWGARLWTLLRFGLAALPGPLAVATLNHLLYGSPLRSGYGDPGLLFTWSHVPPNLVRYPRWLLETHTPLVLLGLVAPLMLPRRGSGPAAEASPRALAVAFLLMAGTLFGLYVSYVVFEDWPYLRFLLPGVVLLLVLTAAVVVRAANALTPGLRAAVVLALLAGFGWFGWRTASERHVFRLHLSEARFTDAATWVRDHVPANAVVLSVWHSGSVRMYGERLTVLWDALDPGELETIVANLGREGRPAYLLVESWEVPTFRERFAAVTPLGGLDWPPRAQIGREIAVYDLADRGKFFRGERVGTARVWTTEEQAAFGRR